jgi:hypothetical protein
MEPDIPEIQVLKPERKADYYLARIVTTLKKKPLSITISNVQWMKTSETHDGNILLRVHLPEECADAVQLLHTLDARISEITATNNQKWFRNALSPEQLSSFFRPSIDPIHPSMTILCKSWAEPSIIVDGNIVEESIRSLRVSKDATVKIVIEAQGIVFQKTRYGIRWVLRKCYINTQSQLYVDTNPFVDEREGIESHWEEEVEGYANYIQRTIDDLHSKIASLQQCVTQARTCLSNAQQCTNEKEWNQHLQTLAKMILTTCMESAFEISKP